MTAERVMNLDIAYFRLCAFWCGFTAICLVLVGFGIGHLPDSALVALIVTSAIMFLANMISLMRK